MIDYPHLTQTPHTEAEWFEALVNLARFLRSPDGCPWDQERTASEFAAFAGDEVGELSEALDSGDDAHSREEFGDSLFTLLACLAAAEAEGRFNLLDALQGAHKKMVRRHAHVFCGDRALTPEAALVSWEEIKAAEKAEKEKESGK